MDESFKIYFQNPSQVVEKIKTSHPCFQDFLRKRTTEADIDGLCESLKSICIGSSVKKAAGKRRLPDILSEEIASSDDELLITPQRRRLLSDIEGDLVPSTFQPIYDEVERSSSLLFKKANKKKKK